VFIEYELSLGLSRERERIGDFLVPDSTILKRIMCPFGFHERIFAHLWAARNEKLLMKFQNGQPTIPLFTAW
jgi:hypothetical protein